MICECTCSSSSIIGPDLQFSKKYSLLLNNTFSAAQDVLSHINCVFGLHFIDRSSSISHDSYCASVLPIRHILIRLSWWIKNLVEYVMFMFLHVQALFVAGPPFWFTTQIVPDVKLGLQSHSLCVCHLSIILVDDKPWAESIPCIVLKDCIIACSEIHNFIHLYWFWLSFDSFSFSQLCLWRTQIVARLINYA